VWSGDMYLRRMALVTCPDCSKEISDAAPTCPGCGRPAQAAVAQRLPRAAAPHSPTSTNQVGPIGAALVVGGAVVIGWWMLRKPEAAVASEPSPPTLSADAPVVPAAPAPSPTKTEAPEVLHPEAAATDVAAVLRAVHPLACAAAGSNNDWAKCHDETKGFDNALRCAQTARAKAKAASAKLPADGARSTCGKTISSASRGVVTTTVKMFDDLVAWLEKHRAQLAGPMANATLQDACESMTCDDEPSDILPAYEAASYARVMDVSCTKTLFQCGPAVDNVCWINKVADRLGVACDATENKTDSPLFVRGTGGRVR
jgi:hypothetical protein